ncbi:MAG: PIN domain-containing protein [Byssovorax sp.]
MTLDSGALIAFERRDRRVLAHLKEAQARGLDLTVPAAVVAEVWRGGARAARLSMLLSACIIEPIDEPLARAAGEAIAAVSGAGTIDAIVMASASARRDMVLTSDPDDLRRLSAHFPGVRVVTL